MVTKLIDFSWGSVLGSGDVLSSGDDLSLGTVLGSGAVLGRCFWGATENNQSFFLEGEIFLAVFSYIEVNQLSGRICHVRCL